MGEAGKARLVEDLHPGTVLDVACGSGALLADALKLGARCFGVDTSRGMLRATRRKLPQAHLVQASFAALPFADESFDTVVETNALSGVASDARPVLDEMLRVCAAEGEIRIADYAKAPITRLWHRWMEWSGTLFGDYAHDYAALLRGLGLAPRVEYLGFDGMYQYVRVAKWNAMRIYFACSITGGRQDEPVYQQIVEALLADGHDVPTAVFALPRPEGPEANMESDEVFRRDTAWIESSDVLIAEVSTPSHGVGFEIGYALNVAKPVLCLHHRTVPVSKMITGNPHKLLKVQAYADVSDAQGQVRAFLATFQ